MKSWKYWNCKVLLVIITTTLTQLNCLFVLYYWSFLCRLMKLLMKWAQFINNYRKSTLGGPMTKQSVLQSCFFCLFLCFVLPRHTNIMVDKGFNLFDECTARCVNLFPQEEDCTSSSWGDSRMYTPRSIANSQRINWNKQKWHYSQNKDLSRNWYCQTLKAFRIIFSEMKIYFLS